jgi:hypothetical protein
MVIKYTKCLQNIPSDHKIYQHVPFQNFRINFVINFLFLDENLVQNLLCMCGNSLKSRPVETFRTPPRNAQSSEKNEQISFKNPIFWTFFLNENVYKVITQPQLNSTKLNHVTVHWSYPTKIPNRNETFFSLLFMHARKFFSQSKNH